MLTNKLFQNFLTICIKQGLTVPERLKSCQTNKKGVSLNAGRFWVQILRLKTEGNLLCVRLIKLKIK